MWLKGQHRLIVQGKSKADEDEICREFTRDFTLPKNVDQYSIKAQLEETTRLLTLVGQVEDLASRRSSAANSVTSSHTNMRSLMDSSFVSETSTTTPLSSSMLASGNKLGSIRETRSDESVEYEIYLGNELKDGQVTLEMAGPNTLVVKVANSDWDSNGDYNLELKRQIKLPLGTDSQHTQHGVDSSTASLLIKVPFK